MAVERLVTRIGVLTALATLLGGTSSSAQPVFRSGVDLVNFGVTVVDKKGTLVSGLTAGDFVLVEEGKPQRIEFFVRGDQAAVPLRVGLLFDTSGSMEKDIGMSRSAAIKFLNTQTKAQEMTLVDFDTEVRVTRYSQTDFPRLVQRVRERKPDGYTALYDALGVYLDGAGGDDGQKVLVIYTDGGDTGSTMTFGDVFDLVKASDVTIYAIGFLENQSSFGRMEQRLRLQQIAEATGGQAFFPLSLKDLDGVYAKIGEEISARYSLGYQSSDEGRDGAWRTVEIKLSRQDLKGAKIRTRKGYFAPLRAGGPPQP
jgi:Ca-activated chloride channel family protein